MSSICKKCFFYGEPLCSYQKNVKVDCDICKYFMAIPQTLFDRITASPEVLAEKLVYQSAVEGKKTVNDIYGIGVGVRSCIYYVWKSAVTGDDTYISEKEAIAATVDKLKEVEK